MLSSRRPDVIKLLRLAMDLNGLPVDLEQFIRQELARGKYESEADLVAKQ
jgi:hypothetical protein